VVVDDHDGRGHDAIVADPNRSQGAGNRTSRLRRPHGVQHSYMSRDEQENDQAASGSEGEDAAYDDAQESAEERRPGAEVAADDAEGGEDGPQPWAKASSGDADSP
jgi:hypothetical protein